MRLILGENEIKYEPSFNDFEISMLNMVDIIIKSCTNIPRVETKLYSESAIQVRKLTLQFKLRCINNE
jgi:hypothetical protein